MVMNVNNLKIGHFYQFDHKRKGKFYAKYLGAREVPNNLADIYLYVAIWTEEGSGQERLANAKAIYQNIKMSPVWSEKYLLASLVLNIETPPTSEQRRLQEVENHHTSEETQKRLKDLEQKEKENIVADFPGYTAPPQEVKRGFFKRIFRRK